MVYDGLNNKGNQKGILDMKTLLIMIVGTIIFNVIDVTYTYKRYKNGTLTDNVLANLIFSFLLYIDIIIYYFTGSLFVGLVVCWVGSYLIVYVINRMKRQNA